VDRLDRLAYATIRNPEVTNTVDLVSGQGKKCLTVKKKKERTLPYESLSR